jgi:hypothetical protein
MKLNINIKATVIGTTTAAVATAVLATSPAHALSFGDELNVIWFADAQLSSMEFYADYGAVPDFPVAIPGLGTDQAGTILASLKQGGSVFSLAGFVKDLPDFNATVGGGLDNFLYFGPGSSANFKLTSITSQQVSNSYVYNLSGFFGTTPGTGTLTTQVGSGARSWSATITAIPTPALLPGLIGLGVGVLRKRKAEEAQAIREEA